jgi:hypothetical protein
MSRQSFDQVERNSVSFDMMVAWQASGGAVEALADLGHEAAGTVHSRQAGTVHSRQAGISGDDGLRAGGPSVQFPCRGDDGLRATMNTALASCGVAEGGLVAGGYTRIYCADDGLQAGTFTRMGCVEDALHAGGPSVRFPCHQDDGLRAFGLTTGVHAC